MIMKKILLITACFLLAVSCGMVDDKYYARPTGEIVEPEPQPEPEIHNSAYWNTAAETVSGRLITSFWRDASYSSTRRNTFAASFTPPNTRDTGFQYWPQAHAMDVVIDAYIRTGDSQYMDYYALWYTGQPAGNGGSWKNSYVDDMEWAALTLLRMYETSENEEYLTRARQIYDDWIWTQWNTDYPSNGGILWNTGQGSKNACSNGPGGVIACKLAMLVDDTEAKAEYISQAKQIYQWLKAILITTNYGVMDNITGGGTLNPAVLTYNQGTVLGTAHGLYKLTGDSYYLDEAIKLAEHVTIGGGCSNTVDGGYVLRDEGAATGDNGLFKGIFIRYFVRLLNDTDVPLEKRRQFYKFLTHNANTLWEKGFNTEGDYRYFANSTWWEPLEESGAVGLQGAVSGATLLEGMYAAVNPDK